MHWIYRTEFSKNNVKFSVLIMSKCHVSQQDVCGIWLGPIVDWHQVSGDTLRGTGWECKPMSTWIVVSVVASNAPLGHHHCRALVQSSSNLALVPFYRTSFSLDCIHCFKKLQEQFLKIMWEYLHKEDAPNGYIYIWRLLGYTTLYNYRIKWIKPFNLLL